MFTLKIGELWGLLCKPGKIIGSFWSMFYRDGQSRSEFERSELKACPVLLCRVLEYYTLLLQFLSPFESKNAYPVK